MYTQEKTARRTTSTSSTLPAKEKGSTSPNMVYQEAGLIRHGSARSLCQSEVSSSVPCNSTNGDILLESLNMEEEHYIRQSSEAPSIVPCNSTNGDLLLESLNIEEQHHINVDVDNRAYHYIYELGSVRPRTELTDEDFLHDQANLKSLGTRKHIEIKAAIISVVLGLVVFALIRVFVIEILFGYKIDVSWKEVATSDSRIASIFGHNGQAFYSIRNSSSPDCAFDIVNIENQSVSSYHLANADCDTILEFRAADGIVCYKQRSPGDTLMKVSKCEFSAADGQLIEESGIFVGFLETKHEGTHVLLEKHTNQPILLNSHGKIIDFSYYESLNTYHHLVPNMKNRLDIPFKRSYVDRSNITLLYGENNSETMRLVTSEQSNSNIRRSSKEKHLKYPEDRIGGVWVVDEKTWIYLCIRDKCWIEVWNFDTLETLVSYGELDKWRDFVGFASKDKLEVYALDMRENLVLKYTLLKHP